jgi:3-deoxy-7-phosphoheptulonate synthase
MTHPPVANLNVERFQSLITPRQLKDELPIGEASQATVQRGRDEVKAILEGRDRRFLALVGPCSITTSPRPSTTPSASRSSATSSAIGWRS